MKDIGCLRGRGLDCLQATDWVGRWAAQATRGRWVAGRGSDRAWSRGRHRGLEQGWPARAGRAGACSSRVFSLFFFSFFFLSGNVQS